MYAIQYRKKFRTGNLAGLIVEASVSYPDIQSAEMALRALRDKSIHSDAVTGAKWMALGAHMVAAHSDKCVDCLFSPGPSCRKCEVYASFHQEYSHG